MAKLKLRAKNMQGSNAPKTENKSPNLKGLQGLPTMSPIKPILTPKKPITKPSIPQSPTTSNSPEDGLTEKTTNIPVDKEKEGTITSSFRDRSTPHESLFCFYKKSENWERKHFLPTEHGVRIGGINSSAEITLNDSDIGNIQVVIIKIAKKWVIMDIGKNNMMRIDGTPTKNIAITPNTTYILKLGIEIVIIYLGDTIDSTPNFTPGKINIMEFEGKKFPINIQPKNRDQEGTFITTLPDLDFTLTPINDVEKKFKSIIIKQNSDSLHIGRSSKLATSIILDTTISRMHSEVKAEGKVILVTDCHTSNGTFINYEEIISPTRAIPGDIITFGNISFILSYRL